MGTKATVNKSSKDGKKLPAGAEVLSKRTSIDVEEIENGWLITKNISIDYRPKGSDHTDYMYITKRYYSEADPLQITIDGDKSLADMFD